jgi:hypothetical protein
VVDIETFRDGTDKSFVNETVNAFQRAATPPTGPSDPVARLIRKGMNPAVVGHQHPALARQSS